ncbi:post-GPI attachment to s factor 2 isoform X3, partial [Brachionus plicatilis]
MEKHQMIQLESRPFKAIDLNFKHLCYFGLCLPLGAFFLCIFVSIVKDFDEANETHCGVFNFLPSISACISTFYPQSTLWRLCIGIDSFPRYLISFVYYKKYYKVKAQLMKNTNFFILIVKIAFMFHNIELTSLLILTYVSSVEIFFIHMISFVMFLISSSLYMMISI